MRRKQVSGVVVVWFSYQLGRYLSIMSLTVDVKKGAGQGFEH